MIIILTSPFPKKPSLVIHTAAVGQEKHARPSLGMEYVIRSAQVLTVWEMDSTASKTKASACKKPMWQMLISQNKPGEVTPVPFQFYSSKNPKYWLINIYFVILICSLLNTIKTINILKYPFRLLIRCVQTIGKKKYITCYLKMRKTGIHKRGYVCIQDFHTVLVMTTSLRNVVD